MTLLITPTSVSTEKAHELHKPQMSKVHIPPQNHQERKKSVDFCGLFYGTVSNSEYMASNIRIIHELYLESIWKEAIVAYSRYYPAIYLVAP
jgi:hypothetical protein